MMEDTVVSILLMSAFVLLIALALPRIDVTVEQLFEDLW